jgi:hypothetical protein
VLRLACLPAITQVPVGDDAIQGRYLTEALDIPFDQTFLKSTCLSLRVNCYEAILVAPTPYQPTESCRLLQPVQKVRLGVTEASAETLDKVTDSAAHIGRHANAENATHVRPEKAANP